MKKDKIQCDDVKIYFSIRECTTNSNHKEYKFIGIKENLGEPVKFSLDNENGNGNGTAIEFTSNFRCKVTRDSQR
jgi:hypothetical protein